MFISRFDNQVNEEMIKFCKMFVDEITLDSLTRPQLTALFILIELRVCKIFGTTELFRPNT